MKRRLFTVLSALSLLLCVAVVALWVRSYSVAHYVALCSETREVGLISTVGHVLLYWETALGSFSAGTRLRADSGFKTGTEARH